MELFDVLDDAGVPTGMTVSREEAHRAGVHHRTSHVWLFRRRNSRVEILLQKRSMDKDSYPGCWDTSSAGHIPSGQLPAESAVRELKEELGLSVEASRLILIGTLRIRYEEVFHGELFRDNQTSFIYVLPFEGKAESLHIQTEEIEQVRWFDLEQLPGLFEEGEEKACIPEGELALLKNYLGGS